RQSPAWVASRSGEVGLFLKDTGPATEGYFKAALDLRPIGQMLNRKPDATQNMLGSDWFIAARNYGYWLSVAGRETESRKLAPAQIEGAPHSEYAQLELAAYYLDHKDTKRALSHVQLAAELKPGDNDVAAMRGLVLLAQGDRKAALEAWAAMMN